ncbi:MAG: TolC family protein [Bacteroidales bacterium]|nr:TolC family protein [Bacteroidales bacterium]
MKKKILGLLFFVPFWGFSQETLDVLTIDQAIEIALENNFSIQIARNNADQVNATLGSAGMLPSISVGANYTIGEAPGDAQSIARSRGSIELGWTIFDGFRMFAAHNRFRSMDEINNVSFRATVENTIREIINQYFLIVSAEQQLQSIRQSLMVSQTRFDFVQARFEVGSASRLDVLNARVDFNTDSSAYRRSLEQMLSAKTNLNQLLARPVDIQFQVTDTIPLSRGLDFSEIHARALEQNASLNIARLQTVMSEASKREIRALHMPTISLNAGYDIFSYNMTSRGFFYGATARMTLFNGFETQRRHRNARLAFENSQLTEQATLLNLETQLRLHFINYETNRDLVSLEAENIEIAQQNMEISLERYQLGNLTALELREAQRNYLNAINRYINSLFLTKVSETILLQLAGKLIR